MKSKKRLIIMAGVCLVLVLTSLLAACGPQTPATPGQTTTIEPQIPEQSPGGTTTATATIAPGTSEPTTAPAQVYKARLAYHWPPSHYSAVVIEKWADEVEKQTNGQIEFTRYPSGQLFANKEMLLAISKKSVEAGNILNTPKMEVDPIYHLTYASFMWPDTESIKQIRWEGVGGEYDQQFQEDMGIKTFKLIIAYPSFLWSTKEVSSIEDFEGLHMRVLDPNHSKLYRAMNANPIYITTGEVYEALRTGMVDAYLTHPIASASNDWWASAKYLSYPHNYLDEHTIVSANLEWWNSIPQDLRDIVENDVTPEIDEWANAGLQDEVEGILNRFETEQGGTIVERSSEFNDELVSLAREHEWPVYKDKLQEQRPGIWEQALEITGH